MTLQQAILNYGFPVRNKTHDDAWLKICSTFQFWSYRGCFIVKWTIRTYWSDSVFELFVESFSCILLHLYIFRIISHGVELILSTTPEFHLDQGSQVAAADTDKAHFNNNSILYYCVPTLNHEC
jgi:hypothetical protein